MGKSSPSPPPAPDPSATAAAQTSSNKDTALYNFGLNNPTVNTPLGTSSYTVDTSNPNQPISTQNITLSPEQQQLYNSQTQQSIDLSNLASSLQGRVGAALGQPGTSYADLQDAAKQAQNAYYNQQTAYLDPQYATQQEQLDNQLANQGIMPGSQAYQTAEDQQNRNKTFAYNQAQQNAILQGPQNAQALFGLQTAARDQPLTEFNALRTGAQPQMPQFQGTSTSQMQPTNVAGITQQGYQNSLNGYNQQVASNNQTSQGLFGLAGSALQAAPWAYMALSDIRLKENIVRLGTEKGFPIYSFSYRADPEHTLYRGVMAQDVILARPDAVHSDGEYLAVDYGKLGIQFGRVQ